MKRADLVALAGWAWVFLCITLLVVTFYIFIFTTTSLLYSLIGAAILFPIGIALEKSYAKSKEAEKKE